MKVLNLILVVGFYSLSTILSAQEMESDLFEVPGQNSLSLFMKSSYTTMQVSTLRSSNQLGMVEETSTTYKKGKINPERINFNTTYTEFFMLEDRKKSIGKYEINAAGEIFRYERTDFDKRNIRTYTYYHYYTIEHAFVKRELIRTKEYIGTGSVEMDTVVTVDSVIYEIIKTENTVQQKDLSEGGSLSTHLFENGKLIKSSSALTDFVEETEFGYDAKGRLASIKSTLVGADGQKMYTLTKIHYNTEGLISEIIFEDQSGEILEKKTFSYK